MREVERLVEWTFGSYDEPYIHVRIWFPDEADLPEDLDVIVGEAVAIWRIERHVPPAICVESALLERRIAFNALQVADSEESHWSTLIYPDWP